MAEYIDKEKLLQKLSRMIEYCKNDNKVNGLTALFQVGDAIMDCPATDVVEVVKEIFEEIDNIIYNLRDSPFYSSSDAVYELTELKKKYTGEKEDAKIY